MQYSASLLDLLGSIWVLCFLLVIALALSIGGLIVARRWFDVKVLQSHHDVSGYMQSVVGTLYAVVLGFLVVTSFNTFQQARNIVESEASSLRDIFHLASGMSSPVKDQLREECLAYARAMIDHEWDAMSAGYISGEGREAIYQLWHTACTYEPKGEHERSLQQSIFTELDSMSDARHERLVLAAPDFHGVLWLVLILGAIMTLLFTYLFAVDKLVLHILLTSSVTIIIGLNLMLIAMFEYPFSGDVHVSPYAFIIDQRDFEDDFKGLLHPLSSQPLLPTR